MNATKRLAIICLLLIGLGFAGIAAALAAYTVGETITLTPYIAGAMGTAQLSDIHFEGWTYWDYDGPVYGEWYYGNVTISCRGLKPKTLYFTPAGATKTNRNGELNITKAHSHFMFGWWTDDGVNWLGPVAPGNQYFEVYVHDAKNRRVLSGLYDYQSQAEFVPGDILFNGEPARECSLP